MNKLLQLACLVIGLCTLSMSNAMAQKYGYINLGNLLEEMPATKSADQQLKTLRDQLVAKGETMAKAFQEKYTKTLQEVQGGQLSPMQQQQKEQELQEEQQKIAQYEQEIANKIQQKRQELIGPILQQVDDAIKNVAKESGYTMIFDSSVFNALLYAEESEDIMAKVKAKLGI